MKKYIGGYSILDLASTTIYADALGALKQDKPVLVYDLPECYFADTIKATTIDGDDVVQITKGGKTITIANDNTITNVGDNQLHRYNLTINNIGSYSLLFTFYSYKKFDNVNNQTLTVEIANNLLNYENIIAYDRNNNNIIIFDNAEFAENGDIDILVNGDGSETISIDENTKYYLTQLF